MKTTNFLTLHSVIYGVFALLLFFVPDQMWPLYGLEINDQYARFLSQHNSIFLGGLAAIGFLLRDLESTSAQIKLLQGILITNLLGACITLYGCLTGSFSGFGWSDPLFFAIVSLLSANQLIGLKRS
ncbi:hypothetical protein [Ferrimonas aestuarii]|uniref:DUF4345 domain-containing protein n=1 Tax=Ferrimonas aestuarii TaxID=2569539 RepID=A0A4U1BM97_9GAMM|nr:hypothetical protein [Ferrimonas aestuarii]TKB54285.1 hypothetical protein FCL42_12905 [Ferrimonas aestuarii]